MRTAVAASADGIDWDRPIDLTRWFLCEAVTPLYYTRVYARLTDDQRRRYNQLTGMFANELIGFLEREFLSAALSAVRSRRDLAGGPLAAALERFHADEQRHVALWRRLNALSDPARYAQSEQVFLRVPAWAARLARIAARRPDLVPLILWVQLVQEERSIDISRRCLRTGADRIEPRYAAIHAEHLRDEARHVQVDCQLIEVLYARRSRTLAWFTATTLERLLSTAFLRPGESTRRIIAALVAEFPDLRALRPAIHEELGRLASDGRYLRMMYSRETTPVTFRMFDRFPEFHRLRARLQQHSAAAGEGGSS